MVPRKNGPAAMTDAEPPQAERIGRPLIKKRYVAAVVAGNALEFYDFLTYAFFAIYIGKAFFPSNNPTASLLSSLATFGAGFITRPIGSFVIGRLGDRRGRKPAMVLSFWMMGAAIIGLALVPSYAQIGVAAPALAIFFRLLQGFALGGDVGPTTAVLVEAAPLQRRGFYSSFQSASQNVATLGAGVVGFALTSTLNAQQLQSFGWRIAFLLGALTVPFALLVRRNLPETFHEHEARGTAPTPWRPYVFMSMMGVLMLANGTIGTYIRTYITTYAIATLHMPSNVAFGATVINGIFGTIFCLISGLLMDRFGRKRAMLVPGVITLILVFPSFEIVARYRNATTLFGATAILAALSSLAICPAITWLTESLPPSIRSGGVGLIYAVSIAVFGGTTQYAVTWLIAATGNPLAPGWYWTVAAIFGLGAMLAIRESAPGFAVGHKKIMVPVTEGASEEAG
jgi:MHS family citrate/tricarballylate:H+ symporter-like MFS transporter